MFTRMMTSATVDDDVYTDVDNDRDPNDDGVDDDDAFGAHDIDDDVGDGVSNDGVGENGLMSVMLTMLRLAVVV